MPIVGQGKMARQTKIRTVANRIFSSSFYLAPQTQPPDPGQQEISAQYFVSIRLTDFGAVCSESSGCKPGDYRGFAHLGSDPVGSFSSALSGSRGCFVF